MFIPWWGLGLSAILIIYLISMDIHLHRRVKRLEKTVRMIEGMQDGNNHVHKEKKWEAGPEDLT